MTVLVSALVFAASLGWALHFIWSTSFRFGRERVFCLFDDAMISMTYARSLVEGRGLTWGRQPDPVEGFTNPLWTLMMALIELAPLAEIHRPLLVQVLGLVILYGCWWCAARLLLRILGPESGRWSFVLAGACVALYPLWYWSLLGLEVGLQALVLLLLATVATDDSEQDELGLSEIVLALVAPLVRMDLLIGVALSLFFILVHGARLRAAAMAIAAGTSLVLYQAFRWVYFGEALPNTYYLKMTGEPLSVRIERGLALVAANPTLVFVGAAFAVVGAVAIWLRDGRTAMLVSVPLAYLAYTVYVGGDAWDVEFVGVSRFTASALPLGLCAVVSVWHRLDLRRLWSVALLIPLIFSINGWIGPSGLERLSRQLGAGKPYLVASHELVYSEVMALEERFGDYDLSVATCWAGIPAYFTDFRYVDCLGYTDRELARQPTNGPARALEQGVVAGHNKRYPELVLDREPDIVYQLWSYGEVDGLLGDRGYRRTAEGWWIKKGLLRRLKAQEMGPSA